MISSSASEPLKVELGERSYPIHIGSGLLAEGGAVLKGILPSLRCLIITDEQVGALHGEPLKRSLEQAGFASQTLTLPAGEQSKSFTQLEAVLETILSHKPDRQTSLIALGGGVIGDLTGFAASILLRGVPFVQIPTSLLAQVDSSVGGKTGINSSHGKNLIGSFYQPAAVLIDTDMLSTLPERQLCAGLAEVIKYGCISEPEFFGWLEENMDRLLAKDSESLAHAIHVSCQTKAAIVAADERESGQRALLNLGHSFGHALENMTGYGQKLLHGEAVAIGMVMAFDYSIRQGHCPAAALPRLRTLLEKALLPVSAHHLNLSGKTAALLEAMQCDKKNTGQGLTLILAKAIGNSFVQKEVAGESLWDLWQDYL